MDKLQRLARERQLAQFEEDQKIIRDDPAAEEARVRRMEPGKIIRSQLPQNTGWTPVMSDLQLKAQREREVYGAEGKEAFLKRSTDSLIKQAFDSTMAERRSQEEGNGLDALYRATLDASKRVSGINPAKSIELLEKAQALKFKNVEFNIKNNELKQAQIESAGDVAFSVRDQDTLNEAIPELAKHGLVVPERFREWNPQTKDWLLNKALKSRSVKETIKIQNETAKIALDKKKEEEDIRKAKELEKDKAADNTRAQEQFKISAKNNQPKIEELGIESKALSEMYPEFSDLPKPIQMIASRDVYSIANRLVVEGKAEDYAEAIALARTQVIGGITEDGYKGASKSVTAPSAKPAPASKFVEGKVYSDKNGNKAMYSNGKWIPQ